MGTGTCSWRVLGGNNHGTDRGGVKNPKRVDREDEAGRQQFKVSRAGVRQARHAQHRRHHKQEQEDGARGSRTLRCAAGRRVHGARASVPGWRGLWSGLVKTLRYKPALTRACRVTRPCTQPSSTTGSMLTLGPACMACSRQRGVGGRQGSTAGSASAAQDVAAPGSASNSQQRVKERGEEPPGSLPARPAPLGMQLGYPRGLACIASMAICSLEQVLGCRVITSSTRRAMMSRPAAPHCEAGNGLMHGWPARWAAGAAFDWRRRQAAGEGAPPR